MDLDVLPIDALSQLKSEQGLGHSELTSMIWNKDKEEKIEASLRAAMLLGDLRAEGLVQNNGTTWHAKGAKK